MTERILLPLVLLCAGCLSAAPSLETPEDLAVRAVTALSARDVDLFLTATFDATDLEAICPRPSGKPVDFGAAARDAFSQCIGARDFSGAVISRIDAPRASLPLGGSCGVAELASVTVAVDALWGNLQLSFSAIETPAGWKILEGPRCQ